eukprot:m.226485 g.226485  ORF g.226485 m.226485 type:complete len:706 (+) comp16958_c0_seq1:1744-3861(+)
MAASTVSIATTALSTSVVYVGPTTKTLGEKKKGSPLLGADVFLKLDGGERQPVHAVCLIDVSGSMGDLASGGADKALEHSAFTCLDLAKHSMATLIEALQPEDSLTVFSFDTQTYPVFPTQKMSPEAKKQARDAVNALRTLGGTHIWTALEAAIEAVKEFRTTNTTAGASTVILLTDGQENGGQPAGGTAAGFSRTLAGMGEATVTLHTLGYGYGVDSKLLVALAKAGAGAYGFIPDATMVGTIFVNFVSTMLATAVPHLHVELQGPPGAILVGYGASLDTDATSADIGLLLSGQERGVHVAAPPGWQGSLVFTSLLPGKETKVLATQALDFSLAPAKPAASATHARLLLAGELLDMLSDGKKDAVRMAQLKALVDTVKDATAHTRPEEKEYFGALISDLTGDTDATGQIGKAVSKAHMQKWGRHYLGGIALCHRMQVSQNFKDASLQTYGGPLFTKLQSEVERLFCLLPPPKATGTAHTSGPAPTSMTSFYNVRGGCFHGQSLVALRDGSFKTIATLTRGDHVLCSDGLYRRVDCVVVSPQEQGADGTIELYEVEGVLLTAYHPVHVSAKWAFPIDVGTRVEVVATDVYNVLLEQGGEDMLVWGSLAATTRAAGVRCITLAHEIQDDAVASHEYLGSALLRADLQCMRGWASGRITLDESKTIRNPVTLRVARWVEAGDEGDAAAAGVVSVSAVVAEPRLVVVN